MNNPILTPNEIGNWIKEFRHTIMAIKKYNPIAKVLVMQEYENAIDELERLQRCVS